jgi:hypothetical protein
VRPIWIDDAKRPRRILSLSLAAQLLMQGVDEPRSSAIDGKKKSRGRLTSGTFEWIFSTRE